MPGLTFPPSLTAPNPTDGSSAGQTDDLFRALTAMMQAQLAPSLAGAFADRPAPGVLGRTYTATDTQTTYVDAGTAWLALVLDGDARLLPLATATTTGDTSASYASTNPASPIIVAGPNLTTRQGRKLKVGIQGGLFGTGTVTVQLRIDGAAVIQYRQTIENKGTDPLNRSTRAQPVSAGSHTTEVRITPDAGKTVVLLADASATWVIEAEER